MNWQDWLDFFYKKYNYHFIVCKLIPFPHPWQNYKTKEYDEFIKKEKFVTQREVFYDEIIFDIDMDDALPLEVAVVEAERIAEDISNRLKALNYAHSVWGSGGTGIHIHSFFPELSALNILDNRIMKKVFLRALGRGYIKPRSGSGKIQLQTNTTIQIEDAKHRKGGRKKKLWEYQTGQPNIFDKSLFKALEEEKQANHVLQKYFKKYDGETPAAISFLESERFHGIKDGRDRALFILTAFYKMRGLEGDKLFNKLSDWNKRVLGNYFKPRDIKAKIRSARPTFPLNYIITLLEDLGLDMEYVSNLSTDIKKKDRV